MALPVSFRSGLLAAFWLLLFLIGSAPGTAECRALVPSNHTSSSLLSIPGLDQAGLAKLNYWACDINFCSIESGLCDTDDNEGGSDYDDECTEDDLDDCPPGENPDSGITDTELAKRLYTAKLPSGKSVSFLSQDYPSKGRVAKTDRKNLLMTTTFRSQNDNDCEEYDIDQVSFSKADGPPDDTVVEHFFELQTIKLFMQTATDLAKLSTTVNEACFTEHWNSEEFPADAGPVLSGLKWSSRVPNHRVFETPGSFRNRGVFLIVEKQINAIKTRIWRLDDIYAAQNVATNTEKAILPRSDGSFTPPSVIIKMFTMPLIVFSYLNEPKAAERLYRAVDSVRDQLISLESYQPSDCAGVSGVWDDFIEFHLANMVEHTKTWVRDNGENVKSKFRAAADSTKDEDIYERAVVSIVIIDDLLDSLDEVVKAPSRPE